MDLKVAREVAEVEFARWAEAMDLDLDTQGLDADDIKSLEDGKRTLLRALVRGVLSIDEKGQAVVQPQVGDWKPIVFHEPSGATFMATDAKKKGQDVAKLNVTMADMTGTHAALFSKLAGRDWKLCRAVAGFLLA